MKIIDHLKLMLASFRDNVCEYDISIMEIQAEVMKRFPRCNLEVTDLKKKACLYSTLVSISKLIPARFIKYETEIMDCEDISIIAWGIWKALFPRLPIGLAFVKKGNQKHALLIAIYKTKDGHNSLTYIEPQTGKVVLTDWRAYKVII